MKRFGNTFIFVTILLSLVVSPIAAQTLGQFPWSRAEAKFCPSRNGERVRSPHWSLVRFSFKLWMGMRSAGLQAREIVT